MAKLLNQFSSSIQNGGTIDYTHVKQFEDAFTGVEEYNIEISGSLKVNGSEVLTSDLNGTNYVIVYGTGTPTENATELQSAYNEAKKMPRYLGNVGESFVGILKGQTFTETVDGLYWVAFRDFDALNDDSAANFATQLSTEAQAKLVRTTVIVAPGDYEFSDVFVFDTNGIYITSLISNVDVMIDSSSEGTSITNGNIYFKGLSINNGEQTIIYDGKPYKVYAALFNQTGTDNPIVTILENTVGYIIWTRNSVGTYSGTLNGAFISDKVVCELDQSLIFNSGTSYTLYIGKTDNNTLHLNTYNGPEPAEFNEIAVNKFFEIRIY